MVFLSIILCVLNIQAQSHFKLYKSEGHFYLDGEMNEIHVDSILLEAECRLDFLGFSYRDCLFKHVRLLCRLYRLSGRYVFNLGNGAGVFIIIFTAI